MVIKNLVSTVMQTRLFDSLYSINHIHMNQYPQLMTCTASSVGHRSDVWAKCIAILISVLVNRSTGKTKELFEGQ
jgi:hypothetical protein